MWNVYAIKMIDILYGLQIDQIAYVGQKVTLSLPVSVSESKDEERPETGSSQGRNPALFLT